METILDYYTLQEVLEMFKIDDLEVLESLVAAGALSEEDVLRRLSDKEQE